jgi:hypothetical protein
VDLKARLWKGSVCGLCQVTTAQYFTKADRCCGDETAGG